MRKVPLGNIDFYVDWKKAIIEDNIRPILPDSLPLQIKETIEAGWSIDPERRPSASEIVYVLRKAGSFNSQSGLWDL